jgi:hypothetical protein
VPALKFERVSELEWWEMVDRAIPAKRQRWLRWPQSPPNADAPPPAFFLGRDVEGHGDLVACGYVLVLGRPYAIFNGCGEPGAAQLAWEDAAARAAWKRPRFGRWCARLALELIHPQTRRWLWALSLGGVGFLGCAATACW